MVSSRPLNFDSPKSWDGHWRVEERREPHDKLWPCSFDWPHILWLHSVVDIHGQCHVRVHSCDEQWSRCSFGAQDRLLCRALSRDRLAFMMFKAFTIHLRPQVHSSSCWSFQRIILTRRRRCGLCRRCFTPMVRERDAHCTHVSLQSLCASEHGWVTVMVQMLVVDVSQECVVHVSFNFFSQYYSHSMRYFWNLVWCCSFRHIFRVLQLFSTVFVCPWAHSVFNQPMPPPSLCGRANLP